jgi:hypothetical protein
LNDVKEIERDFVSINVTSLISVTTTTPSLMNIPMFRKQLKRERRSQHHPHKSKHDVTFIAFCHPGFISFIENESSVVHL